MEDDQRHARIFGVLFIVTFITSIGALALFQPVLDDPVGYIAGDGKDSQIYLGAFLEFLLVVTNVGTAVALYPIARRQNEALAIGYVAARIIESVFIATGIIFVLGIVAMRHDLPGGDDVPAAPERRPHAHPRRRDGGRGASDPALARDLRAYLPRRTRGGALVERGDTSGDRGGRARVVARRRRAAIAPGARPALPRPARRALTRA